MECDTRVHVQPRHRREELPLHRRDALTRNMYTVQACAGPGRLPHPGHGRAGGGGRLLVLLPRGAGQAGQGATRGHAHGLHRHGDSGVGPTHPALAPREASSSKEGG